MTQDDKEFYKEHIKELKDKIASARATGRSSRMLNEYIEDFFQKPMGTKIEIFDHYLGWNALPNGGLDIGNTRGKINARIMMCNSIKRRLDTEYPNVEYELTQDFILIRKTPTYREQLRKELAEFESKLEHYE